MEHWLKTDETEEAISSLEMLANVSSSLSGNIYNWKWAIIAIHNSLQGFMVLALRGSNNLAVLPDDIAQGWLKAHYEGGEFPVERLDRFMNLYKKIKPDIMLYFVHSKKLLASHAQNWLVKNLII